MQSEQQKRARREAARIARNRQTLVERYGYTREQAAQLVADREAINAHNALVRAAREVAKALPSFVDVAFVDDNDGRGPCKLQNSIRCF